MHSSRQPVEHRESNYCPSAHAHYYLPALLYPTFEVDTEGGLPGPGMENAGKDAQNPFSSLHGMPADALRTDGHSHLGRGIDLRPSPAGTTPGFHGNSISPLFLFHRLSRSSLHPPPLFQKGRVVVEGEGTERLFLCTNSTRLRHYWSATVRCSCPIQVKP
ncbi:hypothetical protein HNY73_009907 [Argiope bruennichi]|uniref:Uncharacterized protein n=1 Tax=Argiope bruennichi TaxID=94029 RepID=A0A8T0FB51_ARGBR|nr:hypothetical protein HNY73_009907 [Argiope bruennichi]